MWPLVMTPPQQRPTVLRALLGLRLRRLRLQPHCDRPIRNEATEVAPPGCSSWVDALVDLCDNQLDELNSHPLLPSPAVLPPAARENLNDSLEASQLNVCTSGSNVKEITNNNESNGINGNVINDNEINVRGNESNVRDIYDNGNEMVTNDNEGVINDKGIERNEGTASIQRVINDKGDGSIERVTNGNESNGKEHNANDKVKDKSNTKSKDKGNCKGNDETPDVDGPISTVIISPSSSQSSPTLLASQDESICESQVDPKAKKGVWSTIRSLVENIKIEVRVGLPLTSTQQSLLVTQSRPPPPPPGRRSNRNPSPVVSEHRRSSSVFSQR